MTEYRDNDQFHIITTDNAFMNAIGLGAFTTGILYDWVVENKGKNLDYIVIDPALLTQFHNMLNDPRYGPKAQNRGTITAAFPIMDILIGKIADKTIQNPDGYGKNYHFRTWRKKHRNDQKYEFVDITNLSPHAIGTYRPADNIIDYESSLWEHWTAWPPEAGGKADPVYKISDLEFDNDDINITQLPSYAGGVSRRYNDENICRIIRMNNRINDPHYYVSSSRWKFITDIKASDENGVFWAAPDNSIVIRDANGDNCPQAVNFKLTLFDQIKTKEERFSVANPSTIFSGQKRDSLGRTHDGKDNEGRQKPATKTGLNSETAGELDMWFDEHKGKWKAGSQAVLAIMMTDLPAATPPDQGSEATKDEHMDSSTGMAVATGIARPLVMQGNPTLFAPEYKHMSGCGDDEKEEFYELKVTNVLPEATFASGTYVVLHEIEGIWQPMAIEKTEAGEPPVPPTDVGGWDFTYLVSNADYYFRPGGPSDSNLAESAAISYTDRENDFYDYYYNNVTLGLEPENNCVQLTSWDFMGKAIGGFRNKHALGQTQFAKDVFGKIINEPERQQPDSSIFFGCVFPDGYNLGNAHDLYTSAGSSMVTREGLPASYIKNIDDTEIILGPGNGEATPYGGIVDIFDHASSDSTLHQLPADIALNAHPDSKIGAPMTILKGLEYAFSDLPTSTDLPQTRIANFLSDGEAGGIKNIRYAWLAFSDNSANSGDPTFEFSPINKQRVQFRPLKTEVYASFEGATTANKNERGSFGYKAWSKVNFSESPISTNVLSRAGTAGVIGPMEILGNIGFKYNIDLVQNGNILSDNEAFIPKTFWDQDWQPGPATFYGAGAVGIIGASCKVTANTEIDFDAQCNYGSNSDFTPITGTLIKLGGHTGTFGGRGNQYNSFNETALWARIYQHWPRKQTVYDPRFFAVYHFSAGAGDQTIPLKYYYKDERLGDPAQDYADAKDIYDSMQNGANYPSTWQLPDYKDGLYTVQEPVYDTDIREPTLTETNQSHPEGLLADVGMSVWKDGGDHFYKEWRPVDEWRVNIGARGLLLPIPENGVPKLDIGINDSHGVVLDTASITSNPPNGTSGGSGYASTDTFTTEGGSGSGVVLSCSVSTVNGVDGVITFLSTLYGDPGRGFVPEDFFDRPPDFNPVLAGSRVGSWAVATVKVVPLNVQSGGTGLLAYVQKGKIISNFVTDSKIVSKPEPVGNGIYHLSQLTSPKQFTDDPQPAVNARVETKATIAQDKKSPTNEYDVFLHFHNDMTHTFLSNDWRGGLGGQILEQAIDLTVSAK